MNSDLPPFRDDGYLPNRMPEEIFAAEDGEDWNEWIEFF